MDPQIHSIILCNLMLGLHLAGNRGLAMTTYPAGSLMLLGVQATEESFLRKPRWLALWSLLEE